MYLVHLQRSLRIPEIFISFNPQVFLNLINSHMVLEVAVLNVKAGEQFEKDFRLAGQYIASIPGYRGHALRKCIEKEDKYLLLVNWEALEDHTVGFRQSPQYLKWKELLHHYYDPFPELEHYEMVMEHP